MWSGNDTMGRKGMWITLSWGGTVTAGEKGYGPTADRADELTAVGERGCTPADVMAGLTAPTGSPDVPRMSGARQW